MELKTEWEHYLWPLLYLWEETSCIKTSRCKSNILALYHWLFLKNWSCIYWGILMSYSKIVDHYYVKWRKIILYSLVCEWNRMISLNFFVAIKTVLFNTVSLRLCNLPSISVTKSVTNMHKIVTNNVMNINMSPNKYRIGNWIMTHNAYPAGDFHWNGSLEKGLSMLIGRNTNSSKKKNLYSYEAV